MFFIFCRDAVAWVAVYSHTAIFYLVFTLRCRLAYIVATVSSPLSLLRPGDKLSTVSSLSAINYRQCHEIDGNTA
jgi:hypothetical protein